MHHVRGFVYAKRDYAGFWRRTVAILLDFLLLSGVQLGLPWLWYWVAPDAWSTTTAYRYIAISSILAGFSYLIGMRCTDGGTVGYRIMGIRYAPMLDEPITLLILLYRAFWAVALMISFALNHFWILVDPRKQAWHDKISGFYVVRRGARPSAEVQMKRRYVAFLGMSFIVIEPDEGGD